MSEPIGGVANPFFVLMRRLLSDERVRFLLVGGVNTAIGYTIFVVLQFLVGRHTSYLVSLYGAYLLATLIAFPIHRRFTFRASGAGNLGIDFLKFQGVNLIALAVNTIALPLFVEFAMLTPILAQAIVVIATTSISYFGHKFFTFRRSRARKT